MLFSFIKNLFGIRNTNAAKLDFTEDNEYQKGFAAFYNANIRSIFEEYENTRIEILKTIQKRTWISIITITILTLIIEFSLHVTLADLISRALAQERYEQYPLDAFTFSSKGLLIISIGLIFWALYPVVRYNKSLKGKALPEIIKFFKTWSVDFNRTINKDFLETSGIFSNKTAPINSTGLNTSRLYNAKDFFSGSYKDANIEIEDIIPI
jgi:amino acid permease